MKETMHGNEIVANIFYGDVGHYFHVLHEIVTQISTRVLNDILFIGLEVRRIF